MSKASLAYEEHRTIKLREVFEALDEINIWRFGDQKNQVKYLGEEHQIQVAFGTDGLPRYYLGDLTFDNLPVFLEFIHDSRSVIARQPRIEENGAIPELGIGPLRVSLSQRKVLARFIVGKSRQEVSQDLGLTVPQVSKHISRTRELFIDRGIVVAEDERLLDLVENYKLLPSGRELMAGLYAAAGYDNGRTGSQMGIGRWTVSRDLSRLREYLGLKNSHTTRDLGAVLIDHELILPQLIGKLQNTSPREILDLPAQFGNVCPLFIPGQGEITGRQLRWALMRLLGKSREQIAAASGLSEWTVSEHLGRLGEMLNVSTRDLRALQTKLVAMKLVNSKALPETSLPDEFEVTQPASLFKNLNKKPFFLTNQSRLVFEDWRAGLSRKESARNLEMTDTAVKKRREHITHKAADHLGLTVTDLSFGQVVQVVDIWLQDASCVSLEISQD